MNGSLKLFTWFGIPVYLHWTFSLIFVYALWIGYSNNMNPIGTIWLMGFLLSLFLCVLLHEYGHALTARQYGIQTRDIVLTPIGGIARLERMPEKPVQEFLVAIAGPLVNVGIAIVLLGLGWLLFHGDQWDLFKLLFQQQLPFSADPDASQDLQDNGIQPSGLVFYLPALIITNIGLVVFNMIPAFPMDGGRVFRALLAMRLGRLRATRIASYVGQGFAVLFVVYGLWSSAYTLALIGFFVFTMARTEHSMVQLDATLRQYRASDLVRTQFSKLHQHDWIKTALDLMRHGLERSFLVFNLDDQLVGAISEGAILDAARKRELSAEINRYTQPLETVHPEESLQYVYFLLWQGDHSIIGVLDNDILVGVIDKEGLRNFLRLEGIR